MDLRQFDLNLLVALDALLTEKSVTRAGARMHLSQSAMSGALARLRYVFHDELLVPIGRHMELTPLAQDLVQPVRDILLQVRSAINTTSRFDPATAERPFSIAASDYVTTVLLSGLLQHLASQAPHVTFELRPVGSRAKDDLERGTLDFMIVPAEYVSPLHPTEVLFEESYTCIAWRHSKAVRATLSMEEYLSLGHVVVRVSDGGGPNFDEQVLERLGYKRRVDVWTPSFDTAPHLVVGTNRLATITTRLARIYAGVLPLKLLPVPFVMPPMTEMLQWHKAHDQDPACLWLRDELRWAVSRLPRVTEIRRASRAARMRLVSRH